MEAGGGPDSISPRVLLWAATSGILPLLAKQSEAMQLSFYLIRADFYRLYMHMPYQSV